MCSNKINSVIEDEEGFLWFATSKGLCRYDGISFVNFPLPKETKQDISPETGLRTRESEEALSLLIDKKGDLWIGSFRESTVSWFDGKNFTSVPFDKEQELVELRFITEDKDGNVWFGGRYGILFRYDGKELKDFTELKETNK